LQAHLEVSRTLKGFFFYFFGLGSNTSEHFDLWQLAKEGEILVNRCFMCKENSESKNQLLLHC